MYEQLKQINVLYVEDDQFIREQTSSLLNVVLNNVFCAIDGQEGLELFQNNLENIDVIVTDINMPNLSGIDMVKEIKTKNNNIPIIAVSAYSQDDKILDNIENLFTKYLRKPVQIKEIIDSIEEVVKV